MIRKIVAPRRQSNETSVSLSGSGRSCLFSGRDGRRRAVVEQHGSS